ncbi:MAG: DUF3810 family protein, partial [Chitinophagaceae bacterium]|nr:DUF3810 family protein [Chitinophagaceae bacterium]
MLLILAILLKGFSFNEAWVERYYTYGVYPYISRFLRVLFGWLPFSVGDFLYLSVGIYLVVKLSKFFLLLKDRQIKKFFLLVIIKKVLGFALVVYILFNVLW